MDKWDEASAKAWQAIIAKVNELHDTGETLESIATRLGIKNRASISLWKSGGRKAENTSFPNMLRYLEALGLDYENFLPARQTATIKRIGPNAPEEPVTGENLRRLDVFDTAGAGTPKSVGGEIEPVCSIDIPPEYMAPALFALQVDGHSMEPTIPHRSVVGVGEIDSFRANEIYACHLPYEGIVIKRVDIDRKTKEYVFKSDNPDKSQYPDFRLDIVEDEKLLVGRIKWILKMV